MSRHSFLYVIFALFPLWACTSRDKVLSSATEGTPVDMHYSTLLRMTETTEGTDVTIIDPWDTTAVLQHFVITEPKRNAAVFILPHCGLLDSLGCSGWYKDMSLLVTPDAEQIIDMDADAILVSPFENSGGYGGIEKLGIDIIECADYMEPTPLGRAEWMKLYGRLFGCREKADSLFRVIEKNYETLTLHLSTKARGLQKPRIACDLITSNTWYVPGGNSTISHLIEDAGGDYIFASDNKNGSLALSPETVFDRCIDADIWIIRYSQDDDMTYSQLAHDNIRYSELKAWKTKHIYGCNLSKTAFFEETPFHPDLLLEDLNKVIRSEEGGHYFTPLKD